MKIIKALTVFVLFCSLSITAFAEATEPAVAEAPDSDTVETAVPSAPSPQDTIVTQEKGLVVEVISSLKEATTGENITLFGNDKDGFIEEQILKIEILSGDRKGEVLEIRNDVLGNPFDVRVEEGDKVFLYVEMNNGVYGDTFIRDLWHSDGLITWSFIFLGLVVVVGGKSGLKAIASLGGSIVVIFFILLPMLTKGYSPVPVTVGISALIILLTHLIITGVGKKSWVAMAGTLGGVLVSAGLVYVVGHFGHLNGLGTEEARAFAINSPEFNFKGLLYSGIIIGALGAVMDVAISIASGISEVVEHNPNVSRKKLIKSGFNIGRDIMGSMLNTLIFAYIGTAMVAIVFFYLLEANLVELFNYGFIAEEIARSIIGSIGLLATIPLTATLAGWSMGKK